MGIGVKELVIILLIVLILFGSSRLADVGKGLGEGIKNFKKGLSDGEATGGAKPRAGEGSEGKPSDESTPPRDG